MIHLLAAASVWFPYVFDVTSSKLNIMTLSLTLSSICTLLIMVLWRIFSRPRILLHCRTGLRKADHLVGLTRRCYRLASSLLNDMFALNASTRMAGAGIILVFVLSVVIDILFLQTSWDGYTCSLEWSEPVRMAVMCKW
jgi:hypothetical protein